jgi:hypothetical protein
VNPSSDSIFDSQLKESFTILYGLVFELRQGMEDLQFRLQITDGKISTLLQILSSLQDAFPPDPVGAASAEEPHAETSEGNAQTQRSTEIVVEQAEHEDTDVEKATGQHALQDTSPVANRDESNVDADMQLESKGTLVEEEPWYEAVLATWPGYLPSV